MLDVNQAALKYLKTETNILYHPEPSYGSYDLFDFCIFYCSPFSRRTPHCLVSHKTGCKTTAHPIGPQCDQSYLTQMRQLNDLPCCLARVPSSFFLSLFLSMFLLLFLCLSRFHSLAVFSPSVSLSLSDDDDTDYTDHIKEQRSY